MSRLRRFEGLDEKFRKALTEMFKRNPDAPRSGPEILEWVVSHAAEVQALPEELEDLEKNFSVYIGRAKDDVIVRSHGRKRGYSYIVGTTAGSSQLASAGDATLSSPSTPSQPGMGPLASKTYRQWEGLLHFPASLLLAVCEPFGSAELPALATSLPKKVASTKFGNPDMLLVRQSARRTLGASMNWDERLLTALSKADSSPELILTSVELKHWATEPDRGALFTALAEAAGNSLWANEAALIFWCGDEPVSALDPEAARLAHELGVGVYEIRPRDEDHPLHVHVRCATRDVLRLEQMPSFGQSRQELMKRAAECLTAEETDEVWDAMDSDSIRLCRLLLRASTNLAEQTGFPAWAVETPLTDFFGAQHSDTPAERQKLSDLLAGPVRYLLGDWLTQSARGSSASLAPYFRDALDTLPAADSRRLKSRLDQLDRLLAASASSAAAAG